MNPVANQKSKRQQALAFIFAGILPIILFTVIEEKYGVIPGLVAAMIFSVGELTYEKIRYHKISFLTWVGNGLILGMGLVSLLTADGIWFKLQPAILEFIFFIFLLTSWVVKKPFLKVMMLKQNPNLPDAVLVFTSGLTFRLSLFFLFHAVLATYAALHWSTESWAILKGVGLTVSMILYMVAEAVILRFKNNRST